MAIWSPSEKFIQNSEMKRFELFVSEKHHISFRNYSELWQWSVDYLEEFWESIFQYFEIISHNNYSSILKNADSGMIGTKWFEGCTLNYAEHIFRNSDSTQPAVIFKTENADLIEISWKKLEEEVSAIQQYLIKSGVKVGDRVAGYLKNTPETISIFLAVNALGAVWSCVSPDFGLESILDRFQQIEPKILFVDTEYSYNGKIFDKSDLTKALAEKLPSVEDVVHVHSLRWKSILAIAKKNQKIQFTPVPFEHPIWILYSSGTTGKPKAITHGTGGNLLEHLKALVLHQNVKKGERFFWYSTTGWMMWNYALSSLLCGATLCIYDGSPSFPNAESLWDFADQAKIDHFGGGAAYYIHSMKQGIDFTRKNLPIKTIGSTGSPLSEEAFLWLNSQFPNSQIASISGGTDVATAFVTSCPYLPVNLGEIQCRALGAAVYAYDDNGERVFDEVGELVIEKPMPSMPIYFWNDKDNSKYFDSYFAHFEGVWSHGDWIKITKNNGVIIFGRSDATLNRGGVRIGTAEIYKVLDGIENVKDSLVICIDIADGSAQMALFLEMKNGIGLTYELQEEIKQKLKSQFSPRHVPDVIYEVPEIPYTISGKKMEIPVKRLMMGFPLEKAVTLDAMRNPNSIQWWLDFREGKSL
jgi:acetoacetyl-CoA synthetase